MQPRQLGPYVLEAPLGEGGMAAVYRGRHVELGAVRAVKRVTTRDPAALERFSREAARLAELRHPNVVAIHETGTDPAGGAWFAMELLEGETLARLLERGPLPWARALEVVLQAARGVDALHALGVVHRDLKPQNILVEPGGRVVVIDLGLALAPGRDERLTATGAVVGTVLYLAPEQVHGAASPATDVHALGLILHEALTGRPAMEAEDSSALEVLARIVDGERPRPGDTAPATPATLDRVVARATARDPATRYPRAAALADALEAVRARPGPSAAALRRARRALGAAGAAAVVVALACALSLQRPAAAPLAAPSAAVVTASAVAEPAGLEPARLAEGERDARAVRRLAPGLTRLEAAAAWLARYPDHPGAAELRALHTAEEAGLALAWLDHGDKSDVEGVFVADDEVVTVGRDGTARRWVAGAPGRGTDGRERWRETARVPLPAPGTAIGRTADRSRVLAGCRDGTVHELVLQGGGGLAGRPCGVGSQKARVETLALYPSGRFAVACDAVHPVAGVLNLVEGLILPLGPGPAPANSAAVTRAGRVVVAYGADAAEGLGGQGVRAWDTTALTLLWELPTRARCLRVALAPDERHVAVGTSLGQVLIVPIDGAASEAEARSLTGREVGVGIGNHVAGLVWSGDGRRLYAVSAFGDGLGGLRVWDTATWREARPPVPLLDPVSIDVSPDGRRLAVGTSQRRVELWSTAE